MAINSHDYDLKYKHENLFLLLKVIFNILYTSFTSASFSTQPQSFFIFLQFESGSHKNTLTLSNEVSLSETKPNHGNTKATWEYSFMKKTSK